MRYILQENFKRTCGDHGKGYFTVDGDANAVEQILRSGGFSEETYERFEVIGIEVIDDKPKDSK